MEKFKASFNSGGNDLPCVVMAQVYALYSTAVNSSKTVVSPIVFDAIYQQEPAPFKIDMIWDFVVNKQPKNSQLIISTTELHGKEIEGKTIRLSNERGYENGNYKNMMIQFLKEEN